jgi:hypothetical protein
VSQQRRHQVVLPILTEDPELAATQCVSVGSDSGA